MHQGVATVAFYDTLGEEASLYMFDQTELTTMAIPPNLVPKLAKLKLDDASKNNLMRRVVNLIIFDTNFQTSP